MKTSTYFIAAILTFQVSFLFAGNNNTASKTRNETTSKNILTSTEWEENTSNDFLFESFSDSRKTDLKGVTTIEIPGLDCSKISESEFNRIWTPKEKEAVINPVVNTQPKINSTISNIIEIPGIDNSKIPEKDFNRVWSQEEKDAFLKTGNRDANITSKANEIPTIEIPGLDNSKISEQDFNRVWTQEEKDACLQSALSAISSNNNK